MVLLTVQELEMATPGEADSPPASTEEAASPIPSPPFASPVAEGLGMLPALPSNRTLPPLQRVPPSMAASPVEEDAIKMDDEEPLVEEPPDPEEDEGQPAEEPSAPAEEVMDSPEPPAEEGVVEEPVVAEVASEDAADAPEDKPEEKEEEVVAGESFAEKIIASAEDVIETAQEEVQQATDTLGNKVAKFFGNLRKVKSLLHLNEKVSEEDEEQIKNLSSSTGDLDMAAVRKSRACNIL